MKSKEKICVVGLGYVGLPLFVELAKKYDVIGYDTDANRIDQLKLGVDHTGEIGKDNLLDLLYKKRIAFCTAASEAANSNVYIITVPTPVDKFKTPDLSHLKEACKSVGSVLKKGDLIIFESTVYPGASEEVCIPILESSSKLSWKRHFNIGYSPERINPGDTEHRLADIIKVVSADQKSTLHRVAQIYENIIKPGVFRAESIQVAETAKVIENIQRDINIALINEVSIICSHLNIRTKDVLDAANTKWNFLNFKPGLVGGHCIGVDPYYLAYKAQSLGYQPELLLAGRRLNETMVAFLVEKLIRKMIQRNIAINGAHIAILGVTFKENCPDIRNSKAYEIEDLLKKYGCQVDMFDPYSKEINEVRGGCFSLFDWKSAEKYNAAVILSPHHEIKELGAKQIFNKLEKDGVLFDVKSLFDSDENILTL